MDSIINKLSEIETAAGAVIEHTENQKNVLEQKMQQMKAQFDHDLEQSTNKAIEKIQEDLKAELNKIVEEQKEHGTSAVDTLNKDYEKNHATYADSILQRIIEE